jgi:hypothetical protein
MRRLVAVRYVTPLREGGSLPALVETGDGRLFVVKLRGAGQGTRALVAELVSGELARALGLRVPDLAIVEVLPELGATERDPEVQDLLRASAGANLGLSFLPGAVMYDPAARLPVPDETATRTVLLDALVMNVDRTARNPNLLWWRGDLWLIDHGATLVWQHSWDGGIAGSDRRFPLIAEHVLLGWAASLARPAAELAAELAAGAPDEVIDAALAAVPDDWLGGDPAADRAAHAAYLRARRDAAVGFIEEAARARARRV